AFFLGELVKLFLARRDLARESVARAKRGRRECAAGFEDIAARQMGHVFPPDRGFAPLLCTPLGQYGAAAPVRHPMTFRTCAVCLQPSSMRMLLLRCERL